MGTNRLKIAHLYPKELNLYGDCGNLLCLKYRLEKRGIKAEIIPVEAAQALPDFDLLFIGGGQDREMELISRDIRLKGEMLKYAIESEKTVLAICGGYQLLGEYYKTADGNTLRLSGALPFYTEGAEKRMVGNIIFETPFGTAAGFENHSGRTYIGKLNPLGKVLKGFGNNGTDNTEGLLYKNTFCTYAHGPLLPKNPALADELLSRALKTQLEPIDDGLEVKCLKQLIARYK